MQRLILTQKEENYLDEVIRDLGLDHMNPYYFPEEYDDIEEYLSQSNKYDEININAGASKAVIDLNLNYVIKIPFFTERCWDEYNETYGCRSFCVDGECGAYYPLEGRRGLNYCRAEAEFYHLAKFYGVEDMFAATEFYCTYNSRRGDKWPIYIQEKVEAVFNSHFPSDERAKTRDALYNKMDKLRHTTQKRMQDRTGIKVRRHVFPPTYFMADCASWYGEEKLKRMLEFCWLYDINDLHTSNVGYIGERPVIFDYSGYHNY